MATKFDFYSEDFQSNPRKTFSEMIEKCPIHKSEEDGWYALFKHEDISNVVRDNKTYSAQHGPGPRFSPPDEPSVLVRADPPLHTQQKLAVGGAFSPAFIQSMEPGIAKFVNSQIDSFIENGECDIITDIAIPLPLWVICTLMDVDYDTQKDVFRGWVEFLAASVFEKSEEFSQKRDSILKDLYGFFKPHIERKLAIVDSGGDPGDDLLSRLCKAEIDGEHIPMDQLYAFCRFLLTAGSATTTNLIGNYFKLMLEFPDQYQMIKDDMETYLEPSIEEVLRYDAPVHGLFRTNNIDVNIQGVDLPANSKMCMMWGSANMDPDVFNEPENFDITRDKRELRQLMTFGKGIHLCMGAPLARLECKVAAREFIKRIPDFEANGPAVAYPYATLNGLDHLPIKWNT